MQLVVISFDKRKAVPPSESQSMIENFSLTSHPHQYMIMIIIFMC